MNDENQLVVAMKFFDADGNIRKDIKQPHKDDLPILYAVRNAMAWVYNGGKI